MNHNHYERTDCPSYAGDGKCKFKSSGRCAYNLGNFECKMNGNLSKAPRSKTRYESENAHMIQGTMICGKGVMS